METEHFVTDIGCYTCSRFGVAIWTEGRTPDRAVGHQAKLMQVSSGFHSEQRKQNPYAATIICDICNSALPD